MGPLTDAPNENVSPALYDIEWSSQNIQSTMADHFHSLKSGEIHLNIIIIILNIFIAA